jgi:hypothetical protein
MINWVSVNKSGRTGTTSFDKGRKKRDAESFVALPDGELQDIKKGTRGSGASALEKEASGIGP